MNSRVSRQRLMFLARCAFAGAMLIADPWKEWPGINPGHEASSFVDCLGAKVISVDRIAKRSHFRTEKGKPWRAFARLISKRRAKTDDSEVEVVYNYFAQDYALAPKDRIDSPSIWNQLSELLPWTEFERQALELTEEDRPKWRTAPFGPNDEAGVRRNFRAIAAAAGGEEAGLSVLRRNPAVLYFGPRQVSRAGEALVAGLGKDRAADVIRKNPGVLTIDPEGITDNLGSIAVVADLIDFAIQNSGVTRALTNLLSFGVAVSLGKALFDIVRLRLLNSAPPA